MRLIPVVALSVAIPVALLHAQDSTNTNKERRQIEVRLPLERRAAFDRVLGTFAAQEIPVSSANQDGGVLVGGPVEISHFGALKDNAFFRATLVAMDSTTRVYLSASFVSNSDAAWRGAATGIGSQVKKRL